MKSRQNNDRNNCIGLIYIKTKTELLGPIWPDAVCQKNQTRQRRDRSYRCNIHWKQNWPIVTYWSGVVCNKNEIGQWHDWMDKCNLHWKWYWTIVIDWIKCHLWWKPDRTITWSIAQVQSMLKIILNFHDRSNQVSTITKTRQEHYMSDRTGAVYVENETELSWSIKSGAICDKNQTRQRRDQS